MSFESGTLGQGNICTIVSVVSSSQVQTRGLYERDGSEIVQNLDARASGIGRSCLASTIGALYMHSRVCNVLGVEQAVQLSQCVSAQGLKIAQCPGLNFTLLAGCMRWTGADGPFRGLSYFSVAFLPEGGCPHSRMQTFWGFTDRACKVNVPFLVLEALAMHRAQRASLRHMTG